MKLMMMCHRISIHFLEEDDKEDQLNEAIYANAINVDKEEMNENSLLKLLESTAWKKS